MILRPGRHAWATLSTALGLCVLVGAVGPAVAADGVGPTVAADGVGSLVAADRLTPAPTGGRVGDPGAVEPFFIFKPIDARGSTPADRARIASKWDALAGMTPEISRALTDYEMNPDMGTAIGVLEHYKTFSTNDALREAFHTADPQVFLTLDAAKYELVMQTQAAMKRDGRDIGHAMRVGSSGERHRAWLQWVAEGSDLSRMPVADLNKQFQSDDDVTNFPRRNANSFTEAETLNGESAAGYFLRVTEEFGRAMHPGVAMVEFLSPTRAWDIRATAAAAPRGRVGGGINADDPPGLPTYLHEWVLSDPEKYNSYFAVEQLDQWAYAKGVITEDVLNPGASTRPYRDVYQRYHPEGLSQPRGFPEADLFGWMTNQTRQLFQTHDGELKYLKKYTERMSEAWRWFQERQQLPPEYVSWVQPPAGFPELSAEELEAYNRRLLVAGHERHLDLLVERLRAGIVAGTQEGPDGTRQVAVTMESLQGDPQLNGVLNALAVAYANLDPEMRREFDQDLRARVDAAQAGTDPYAGHVARYLSAARADLVRSVGASLRSAEAFREMRQRVGARLNDHLRAVGGANLDALLLRVATGEFTRGEVGLMWDGTTFVERAMSPGDVLDEVRVIEDMARTFGWSDETLARRVHEYFEGEPHVAVDLLVRLHRFTDPSSLRPITVRWTDELGATRTQVIETTRVEQGMSLGLASFKAAVQGGQFIKKVYGQYNDGYQLYANLKAIYWDSGTSSPEQMARAHAQVVASAVGLVDVVEHFGYKTPGAIGAFGGTLGTAAKLSGGAFMDEGTARQLTLALTTDLLTAYVPQVATVLFLKDVATGIYSSWTLSSARSDVVDLLVENGVWTVDSTGVKPPELQGWLRVDGSGRQELVADVREVARRQPSPFDQGVRLLTSGRVIQPREALLDLAYVGNQIETDQLMALNLSAARAAAVTANVGGFLDPIPGSRQMTTEWIRDTWGIAPTIDDDTRLDFGATVPVYLLRDDPGDWGGSNRDWEAHRSASARKVFGRLVADIWGRRQVLLEDRVLPPLIEEAARRRQKELAAQVEPLDFQKELDRLDARAGAIDKATWPLIARSSDPFPGTGYNADTDLPIRDAFRAATAEGRGLLAQLAREVADSTLVDPLEAKRRSTQLLQSITDVLFIFEARYGAIRKLLQANRGWVKQEGPEIQEFHLPLTAETNLSWLSGNISPDSARAVEWAGAYRDEEAEVARAVGARMQAFYDARGLSLARDVGSGSQVVDDLFAGVHDVIYQATGQGDWLSLALAHPWFPYLLRLRKQIHKVRHVQTREAEASESELTKALSSMQKKGRAFLPGDLGPQTRTATLAQHLQDFETEYQELLDGLFDLVSVDVQASPSDGVLLGSVQGAATVQTRTDLPAGPATLDARTLVRGYRWFLNGSAGAGESDITTEAGWEAFPLRAGTHLLEVVALGPGDISVGRDTVSIEVAPARFTGSVEVVGGDAAVDRPWVVLDGQAMGRVASGSFDLEVSSITEDWLERYRLKGGGPPGREPRAWLSLGNSAADVSLATAVRGPAVLTRGQPGTIAAEQLLVLNRGARTLVTVEVTDAAGYSIVDAEVTATGPRDAATSSPGQPEPLLLDLRQGESFSVRAERAPPNPAVVASRQDSWTSQQQPFVQVELPFFEAGHLTVTGSFEPVGDLPLEIAGGSVQGPSFGTGVVGADGAFSVVNDRVLRLEEGPTLDVLLEEAQDYLIRPVARPLRIDLAPGHELSVGPSGVERYEVRLDRFAIAIHDVSGAPLSAPDVVVQVNGEPAPASGVGFQGSGVFQKTTDALEVTASMAVGSTTIEGSGRVVLSDIPVWESPVLPDPLKITLDVFGPGRFSLVGGLGVAEVPDGRRAPTDVSVTSTLFAGDWAHQVGERFSLDSPDPVPVGATVEVTAAAEADGVQYQATGRATVEATRSVLDLGELVLRPLRSPDEPDSASDASGSGASGSGGSGAGSGSGSGSGTGLDDVIRDLEPLTSSLEEARDEARLRCDWAAAAGAQRRIVELVERWLASVFPAGVPAEVGALRGEFQRESAALDRAEAAERTAGELQATARVEAGAGQTDAALATLRDAAAVPDLPACELQEIDAAIEALADEASRLMRQSVDAANQCDFVAAVRFGDQVAAIDANLEWVQTDLLEFRVMARGQERAERLMDQAASARAGGDLDSAGRLAEQALTAAPECDRGWIQGFIQTLQVGPGAAPVVAVDRSVVLLIDASGSMGSGGKIEAARSAAQHTVRSLGPNVEVALMTYSGGCGGGWRVVQDFTVDRGVMEQAIAGVSPGGGTPMAPAVGAAQDHLERRGQGGAGQILLLSDGQNDCGGEGAVRDAGARIRSSGIPIQLDGVGLGLESGGTAETQLGDLVRAAGTGKQYSANSADELYRAFRRASLAGQVRTRDPYVDGASQVRLAELYQAALAYLQQDDFESARLTFEQAAREHPGAASAQFNLSLAYEAEGRTLSAIEAARRYLDLAGAAPDRASVEERIRSLEELQRERPNAIFDPNQCPQLYAWARGESSRVRDPDQRALAFSILAAAQRGDCGEANRLYEAYSTRYGG